ncbi:MAG TPA: heavy metal translocating P-type ATPase [Candidatus Saccharimonadales bacterium]|nr:heavy metal translocating P-type ATPase [Candidatus Saccharimonadales bacterium]
MKKIVHFFKEYAAFGFALLAAIIALALDLAGKDVAAHWVLGITAGLELIPLLRGMWEDLQSGTYGVDILAATAIITSIVMHEYWAAIVIVLMLSGGESLEDYADKRASRELDALLDRAPQKAHVLRGRKVVDVRVKEVTVGDKILIKPGEIVPVDAEIIEGAASFDESSLTGESLPRSLSVGDSLLSGSVNLDGAITARAIHSAADSQYEQIIKLVQAASNAQTPFVRLADRYSVPFTAISFAIAGLAWWLSGDSLRFLQVLVVATPCPLILAAPIAVISGMSRSAKQGVIVKTGSSLERLAEAKTFAFDKTGTLTSGELVVDSVKTFHGYDKETVLGLATSIEQNSTHVLAQAIVAYGTKKNVKTPKAKNVKEVSGKGALATIGGKQVLVGRAALLQENDIVFPSSFKANEVDKTAAYIAIDGKLAGVITCRDEIRAEAAGTIKRLKKLGISNFLMVTGDNKTIAHSIGKELGIKDITAEALPADKLQTIENLPEKPVAFVGDGVNDAPVLTASDVGIALGARGSTAASESADVVIMKDDLSQVAVGTAIAKRTFFIAKQSIFIGIGMSIGLMALYSTGKFSPVSGALVQELVDVVVIFNALRAHAIKV